MVLPNLSLKCHNLDSIGSVPLPIPPIYQIPKSLSREIFRKRKIVLDFLNTKCYRCRNKGGFVNNRIKQKLSILQKYLGLPKDDTGVLTQEQLHKMYTEYQDMLSLTCPATLMIPNQNRIDFKSAGYNW